MTTSVANELDRTRGRFNDTRSHAKGAGRTFQDDVRAHLAAMLKRITLVEWPNPKYRNDPVGFFRDVLGVEPWHRQVEVIEAVRDHKRVAVKSGHKVSKDLADDTPILTPKGWTTHGALEVGDEVFAPDGTPTRIVSTTRYASRPILRVHFEDGSHIDASDSHDWVVRSRELRKPRNEHKPPIKLTTAELHAEQRVPNGGERTIRNWTVDLAEPLRLPVVGLPLDPYLLGLWLGDGSTNQAIFTGVDGLEKAFAESGFKLTKLKNRPSWYVRGFLPTLRTVGILGNKHVPGAYKRASAPQRLAVLRGLMDTDGRCTVRGRASFTNTSYRLALDVAELARSLGQKVRVTERRATLHGKDCGPCWVVQWASPLECFGLARKNRRIRQARRKKANAHRRIAIERIERREPASTQCIEVEHESHLYLAGESLIPTHNSHTAAGIALWFWCSFTDARVVMTSTTSRQVDDILWRETRMMRARAGLCVACKAENEKRTDRRASGELVEDIERPCIHSAMIGGECGELARTGLKSEDFREIKGFTAREAEAVAGISGRNLLYILDEASGIKPEIFEAIEGNRAGGARVVMFSNPTKTSGEFFDAFHSKERFYSCHTISSEETPNVVYGDDDPRAIPGLATREWVEEKKDEWGEDSALYRVRVKGEHVELEEGKIFSIHCIAEAEARRGSTPGTGRLFIGFDPSGDGPAGDEAVWCSRRGYRMQTLFGKRGLSKQALLMHTLGMVREERRHREIPVLVMDSEGKVGAEVYGHFRAYLDARAEPEFELIGIRASNKAHRTPLVYDRQRDELAGNFLGWLSEGGAIVTNTKLAKEMHAFEWVTTTTGRVKITPKKEIKKMIGRSCDRYDAAVLSVWEPLIITDGKPPRKSTSPQAGSRERAPAVDPYAGADAIDPYGEMRIAA